eukprot:c47718_g1_i1 orf=288-554(+)
MPSACPPPYPTPSSPSPRSRHPSLPDHLLMQCLMRLPWPNRSAARGVCCHLCYLLSASNVLDHRSREDRLETLLCVLGGIDSFRFSLM